MTEATDIENAVAVVDHNAGQRNLTVAKKPRESFVTANLVTDDNARIPATRNEA